MKPEVNAPKSSYNNGGIQQDKEKPNLDEIMIYVGFKSIMGLSWVYLVYSLIAIALLLAILFGWKPGKKDIPSSYNPSWGYSNPSGTETIRRIREGE
jgi:hypothetical protein